MNEGAMSSGSLREKSGEVSKQILATERNVLIPRRILEKVTKPEGTVEKADYAGDGEQAGLGSMLGLGRFRDKNAPKPENFRDSSSAVSKTVVATVAEEHLLTKEDIEKVMKETGWDKLPMSDKAKTLVEDAISKGARPVTEYTGKYMVDHGMPEEPPAFVRPGALKAGDRVIPLHWTPMGVFGAKFDMPYVPETAKVNKILTGQVTVTKDAYPLGRCPSDIGKCATVKEDRMWGMVLEPENVKKEADGKDDGTSAMPIWTRDTTMVLRLEPLSSPSGEISPAAPV